jgi:hypothetical protein
MTTRYRVTVDLTLKDFGLTPLAHLHAILHSRLADGNHIFSVTIVDAHDLSGQSVANTRQAMKDEAP